MEWTIEDLKSKRECFKVDQTYKNHCYILVNSDRHDFDGHDISRDDIDLDDITTWDLVWSIISTQTGEYFVHDLEPEDMVKILNVLNFKKQFTN